MRTRIAFSLALVVSILVFGASKPLEASGASKLPMTSAALAAAVTGRTGTKPPAVPHCYSTGSGYGLCEGEVIPMPGTIILLTHPDQHGVFKLTGPSPLQTKTAVACGDLGCVYNHLDWVVYTTKVSGCAANTTTCSVKANPGYRWSAVYVRQNNNPAILYLLWNSGKPGGTITGFVRDRDEVGVANASVRASGTTQASGTVDPTSGLYAVNVPAGRYTVTPSGGPTTIKAPKFDPPSSSVSVTSSAVSRANFTLNGGLIVHLSLSQTSVPADGQSVVRVSIVTTLYGRPDPNVTIALRPQPAETTAQAVATGPRVVVCNSAASRIWPQDAMMDPLGSPVDVVTDATGAYDFTLTVGTVPGSFVLNAWAMNAQNVLYTADLRDTSPDATLTVTAPGSATIGQFVSELAVLKSDAASSAVLATMTNDATGMTQALVKLSGVGDKLGGLSYSLVSGTAGGAAVLIYQDTTPPLVAPSGVLTGSAGSLVISPAMWVGTKLIPITALNSVMQKGMLQTVPTFAQWVAGSAVPGWQLAKNAAVVVTSNYQYDGWPYPSTATGACS